MPTVQKYFNTRVIRITTVCSSAALGQPAPNKHPPLWVTTSQLEPSNSWHQTPRSFAQPSGNGSLWNHEPHFSGTHQLRKTITWFLFFSTALQNILALENPAGKSTCKGICLCVAQPQGRILPMLKETVSHTTMPCKDHIPFVS